MILITFLLHYKQKLVNEIGNTVGHNDIIDL